MEENLFQPDPEKVLDNIDALKAFFDKTRREILEIVAQEPRSVQQIAEILEVPFTRLYYHIKLLERHEIIKLHSVRALTGVVEEKFYIASARTYVINPDLLQLSPIKAQSADEERLLTIQIGQALSEIRRSVADGLLDLKAVPPNPEALLTERQALLLSAEALRTLQEQIRAILQGYLTQETSIERIATDEKERDDEYDEYEYVVMLILHRSANGNS